MCEGATSEECVESEDDVLIPDRVLSLLCGLGEIGRAEGAAWCVLDAKGCEGAMGEPTRHTQMCKRLAVVT